VRALSAALDLTGEARDAFLRRARMPAEDAAVDELANRSLPIPPTALLGRDTDLQTLHRWLSDRSVRLITLTGPGGAGKTRLALEITHALASERTTRVVFVSLAATRNPAHVAPVIAEALGLSDDGAGDLPMRARAACGDRPTLLVLDNFEQVLDAAPLVSGILTSVASLRALITSRAPLRVRGEREYVVGPLDLETGSEEMFPADLARVPAVRLFLERVRDAQPEFRLTPENGPTITAICRRLDALPLALELAAPWLKVLAVEDLLRRLERDVLLSTMGRRDLPERQQTINATVAWSYQLLDRNEQRAFRCFGALPGLFPIDAAAAVLAGGASGAITTDEALRVTARLIDKSLLQRAETSVVATCPLYQMLETVRAFAAAELGAMGERDGAMEGLVHYCAAEAALAAKGLVGPEQVTWLDRVREDLESYRSAMAWLIDGGRPTEACDIAWSLMFFWLIRGHAAEGLRWYEQVLALPSLTPVGESRARIGAAVMLYAQGRYEHSRSEVMRALALADDVKDIDLAAQAEHLLGHLEYAAGNPDAADRRFGRSVEGFRTVAVPWGAGHALSGMAGVALATGDVARAERLLDDAASALREAGPWFMSLSLYIRALAAVRSGNPDRTIALVGESLARIRELHDKFALVYSLVPLAAAAVLKGDHAWAARILGAREAVMERTGVAIVDTLVHDLRNHAEQKARGHLSPERWASAYADGRRSSIDALQRDIEVALRGTAPATPVR
jgi:predicted ATPase